MLISLLAAAAIAAPEPGWTAPKPYAAPILGAGVVSVNGATVGQVTGGAVAGFRMRHHGGPVPWLEHTRLRGTGTYGIGSGSLGGDVRLGSFIGPDWGVLQVQVGPDVSYNGYGRPGASDYHLPWAPGLAIVTAARLRVVPKVLVVNADITPGWVFSADRQAGNVGPFSEASGGASVSLNAGPIGLTVGARRHWTAAGRFDTITLGAAL